MADGPTLDMLETALGHRFKDLALRDEALTHSSFANEAGDDARHYERLEFLGDATIELAISRMLYRRLPDSREGRLTQLRARLVNAKTLAEVARGLGLGAVIRMGRGEELTGGRDRTSILSDVVESLVGAIFVEAGFETAAGVVEGLLSPHLDEVVADASVAGPKTRLQELAQRRFRATPTYMIVGAEGPGHEMTFEASVTVGEGLTVSGVGRSKQAAEKAAARAALATLMGRGDDLAGE